MFVGEGIYTKNRFGQCPVLTAGTPVAVVEGLIGLVIQGWLIVVSGVESSCHFDDDLA